MAAILLAAFPFLLLFDRRLAGFAIGAAIVLQIHKRMSGARPQARRRNDFD